MSSIGPWSLAPEYARLVKRGSNHLQFPGVTTLTQALRALRAAVVALPSGLNHGPAFGSLDALLLPLATGVDPDVVDAEIGSFWQELDHLAAGSATAVVGPELTPVSEALLRAEREHGRTSEALLFVRPDPGRDDGLIQEAVHTLLATGRIHLADGRRDLAVVRGGSLAVPGGSLAALSAPGGEVPGGHQGLRLVPVGCGRSVPAGGGVHAVTVLDLVGTSGGLGPGGAPEYDGAPSARVPSESGLRPYLESVLPVRVGRALYRLRLLVRDRVEGSTFFEDSWLVREGLVHRDRFTAVLELAGVAEAARRALGVDTASPEPELIAEAALRITDRVAELVAAESLPYCDGTAGRAMLRGAAGTGLGAVFDPADRSVPVDPGRLEPPPPRPYEGLRAAAPLSAMFPAGICEQVSLDPAVVENPRAAEDLLRGALRVGVPEVAASVAVDAGPVTPRVTGFYARRRDVVALREAAARKVEEILGRRG